jgi:trans-feruloyl-CoA hydratase/vanillin synthase
VPNDEQATDYTPAKAAQLAGRDPERGRKEGLSQFLDTKEYQPGLGAYRRDVP